MSSQRAGGWIFLGLGWSLFSGLASAALPTAETHECRLWTDSLSIVHVRTRDELGAYRCLGYLHARHRAFQMDLLRRIVNGRAAEMFGAARIKSDVTLRLLDLVSVARRMESELPADLRARLTAYAEGANVGLPEAVRVGVHEFRDYGYSPAPWTVHDSLSVLLLMSLDQTRQTFEEKVLQSKRVEKWGRPGADLFLETGMPWETTILKPEEFPRLPVNAASHARKSSPAEIARGLEAALDLFPRDIETGSNNWVVAPARAKSGHALLANDPHLRLTRPAFWYWVHLSTEDGIEAVGSTIPGVPDLVAGMNREVAWGLTNAYLDVSDVVSVPTADLPGLRAERPWIWFKWGPFKLPFFFKKLERTAEGLPILPVDGPKDRKLVLFWSGFQLRGNELAALGNRLRLRSAAEADAALARTGLPAFNYVFADTRGNIGYRAIGKAPRRMQGFPDSIRLPAAGEAPGKPSVEWRTPAEMPHVMNPARGFVATANNRHWEQSTGQWGGTAYRRSFRAFRIEEMLRAQPKHDLESLKAIQCDATATDARWVAPVLVKSLQDAEASFSDAERLALGELREWAAAGRFDMRGDCRACVIYRVWQEILYARYEAGKLLSVVPLYRMLTRAEGASPEVSRGLVETFREAVASARGRGWRDVHQAPFPHLADANYDRVPALPTPADEYSVNLGQSTWDGQQLRHESGPSFRMVVEMSSPPRMELTFPGEAQDLPQPAVQAADSNYARWARCEHRPVAFPVDWSRLDAEIVHLAKSSAK